MPKVQQNDIRGKSKLLFLSSALLDDRKLLFTNAVDVLKDGFEPIIWATSACNEQYQQAWQASPAMVENFPEVRPFREFPYNYLRRLNEFAWDFRLRTPSRLSVIKHIKNQRQKALVRAMKLPAWMVSVSHLEKFFEKKLEAILLRYPRSEEAEARLEVLRPIAIISTGPNRYQEPAIVGCAKNLGIPILCMIHSWDNLSTKNRMVFHYDGYLVWSEQMKMELHHFYPRSCDVPVYVIGAVQFDVFFQSRFRLSREEFCTRWGLDPMRPIIVYALGAPNFLRGEWLGALYLAEQIEAGVLGNVQMLLRPHPQFDNGELVERFRNCPSVVVQSNEENANLSLENRFQDEAQICEWVNTFRHADVVVNLSSTVAIDAAIMDRPVVNLDFDPSPDQSQQALIKDVNHRWVHFKPIAESGGLWLVNDFDELVTAVKTYLKQPELHREKRRWMAEYVCGYIDGRCGERMALAISDFVKQLA